MKGEPTTAPAPRSYARFFTSSPRCEGCGETAGPQGLTLYRTQDGRGLMQCHSRSACVNAAQAERNTR